MKRTRITVGLILTAAAALAAAGCATTGHPTSAATAPAAAATSAAPATTPAATPSGPAQFGRAHGWTYSDDLQVAVVSATTTAVGQYAGGGHPGDPAVILKVRVTAGKTSLDASEIQVDANAGPDGSQLEAVFDTGIDNPSGTLTPGQHGTYLFEFDAQHSSWESQLNVTVTPGFDYNAASFTGAAS
jgi:hypothetical protein